MTTLPTPLFIVLCILAVPTVCGFVVLGFVVYLFIRVEREERQREKSSIEKLHKSIDIYLRTTGGKKWNMH